jgi:hypothetical protein
VNVASNSAATVASRVFIVFVYFVFAIALQGKIWRIIYPDVHSILSEYSPTPGSDGCVENLYIVFVCFLVANAPQEGKFVAKEKKNNRLKLAEILTKSKTDH